MSFNKKKKEKEIWLTPGLNAGFRYSNTNTFKLLLGKSDLSPPRSDKKNKRTFNT